ncbi:uncharacterized protein METZ01_LOCUS215090 [marine metagenome]|uniref:Uncharacterized protein n=1 Tax=marine metagenome TaxID=408172 RepID=A0A382FGM8_9ZZZZ
MLLQILLKESGDLLKLGLVLRVGVGEGLVCLQAGAGEFGFVRRFAGLNRLSSLRFVKRLCSTEQLEDSQVVEQDANRLRWSVE